MPATSSGRNKPATPQLAAKKRNAQSATTDSPASIPIAVVGVGALFPGAVGPGAFWKDIMAGTNHITEVPPTHFFIDDFFDEDMMAPDKTYCRTGAFLPPVEFDPMAFGIPPKNIESTDTSQLLGLIVAKQVLNDATAGQFKEMDKSRVSVILGVAAGLELMREMVGRLSRPIQTKVLREEGFPEDQIEKICDRIASHCTTWKESTFPGLLGNVVAGRIANHFGLGGINCTSDAACASSFSALFNGVSELQLGRSDLVITGGVDTNNAPFLFVSFSKTPALSPTHDCRPFSDKADGMVLGEGIGMIALKRLSDAERDGDRIYAVLKGIGSSSDGKGTSIYSPVAEGQAVALRRAYEAAGYTPDTVDLVEAHGTGTKTGDIAEFKGLSLVFNDTERKERQWCALGSVKSQIGHTKSAAAAAGIIKAIMAVHHRVLPPTIKIDAPDPKLNITESPFYLNTTPRPWVRHKNYPRRASVSSFGFGGTNFHVTLEEYTGKGNRAYRVRTAPEELIVISGKTVSDLTSRLNEMIEALKTTSDMHLFLARESRETVDCGLPMKIAIIASSDDDLTQKATTAKNKLNESGTEAFTLPGGIYFSPQNDTGKIAFVFPGQGSQYPHMGRDLFTAFEEVQDVWDLTETISWNDGKERLSDKVFPIPAFSKEEKALQAQTLTDTKWAQPAILTTSVAMAVLLEELGITPDCVGGHSLGELSAMYTAGVLDIPTLLDVVRERSTLMSRAAEKQGAMTAVIATYEEISRRFTEWNMEAVIANHNSPAQVVISGTVAAIEAAEQRLKEENIRFKRLSVSAAFHSPLMTESCEPFLAYLKTVSFKKPAMPLYACVTGKPHEKKPEKIIDLLAKQLDHPVKFAEQIMAMYESGVRTFVEVGPSPVLSGLIGKILQGKDHKTIHPDVKKEHGVTGLLKAVARLFVAGIGIDFDCLQASHGPMEDPRLQKKPKISVSLLGCNYNRPYPPKEGRSALPKPNPPKPKETLVEKISTPEVEVKKTTPPASVATFTPKEAVVKEPVLSDKPRFASPAPVTETPGPSIPGPAGPVWNDKDETWIKAIHDIQQQTATAHAAYQQTISDSHMVFLKSVEAHTQALTRMMETLSGNTGKQTATPQPMTPIPSPTVAKPEDTQPVRMSPPQTPRPPVPEPLPAVDTTVTPPTPVETAPAPQGIDFKEMLLTIVADKTGYPKEILGEDMGLESDLGIDSIKRVEILSAVKDESPWLPEVDPGEMADIETLGDVLRYIEKTAPQVAAPAAGPVPMTAVTTPESLPADVDFKEMLLSIVADKTGYPKDILTEDMGLESDLGIDSIKRVEILSAVKDESPWLPEVDPSEMGEIETLKDVIDYIEKMVPSIEKAPSPADDAPLSPAEDGPRLGRYVLMVKDAPHSMFAMKGLAPGKKIVITDDRTGVAQALEKTLTQRGLHVRVVNTIPDDADGVICLEGLSKTHRIEDALAINREIFCHANKVASRFTDPGGLFVTVQDTGGDFGIETVVKHRYWLSGLTGLVKTAAIEWPEASVKAMDIHTGKRSPADIAADIENELFNGGPEIEVGLKKDGTRIRLESVEQAPNEMTASLDNTDVILASGGARGVTARTLIALARATRCGLVLLGRTELTEEPDSCSWALTDGDLKKALLEDAKASGRKITPQELGKASAHILSVREIKSTLHSIEEAGAKVQYIVCDVQDDNALKHALKNVRKDWGPVTGIVHGAGVLTDKLIADKTVDQFDRVFDTKVKGLAALLKATKKDPLKVICLFSSVAARFGNMGQCDYAMANEILNKAAAYEAQKRKGVCVVKSINWGPWDGGMVSPLLKDHFKKMGIPLIPMDVGARNLVEEVLESTPAHTEITIGPKPPGAGLSVRAIETGISLSVPVSKSLYPFIMDHQIKGTPVLPAVLVLEWFIRATQVFNPDLDLKVCKDLRVYKGITLPQLEKEDIHLTVNCRQISNGDDSVLSLELPGENGAPHYTATIEMARPGACKQSMDAVPDMPALDQWSLKTADAYDKWLFHGPEFKVIQSLSGISHDKASAVLSGVKQMNWPGNMWCIDAAALDGGLQLAILWGAETMERSSLPTKIGAYIRHQEHVKTGPITCLLSGRKAGNDRTLSDILFFDEDRQLSAELRDVELHMMPDTH